jgi:hypothetical protein
MAPHPPLPYRSTLSIDALINALIEPIHNGFQKGELSTYDTIENVIQQELGRFTAMQFFDEVSSYQATTSIGSLVNELAGDIDHAIRKGRISTDDDLGTVITSVLEAHQHVEG